MVVVLLLRRDALEVNVFTVRFFVLKSWTAHQILSDALIIPVPLMEIFATTQLALVKILSNAGMAFVWMMNLNVQQDLHAQIANQSSVMMVHALTHFRTALTILPALLICQFDAILETADNTRRTAQPFQLALNLCLFFARMALAESPFNIAKVLRMLLFLKEKSAALMVLSLSHSHCALPVLLVQEDILNAGMEPVYQASLYALLLKIYITMLSDVQMDLWDQASKIAQQEESAHHLLLFIVMMETADSLVLSVLLIAALVASDSALTVLAHLRAVAHLSLAQQMLLTNAMIILVAEILEIVLLLLHARRVTLSSVLMALVPKTECSAKHPNLVIRRLLQ
jgi:hypothetical protein